MTNVVRMDGSPLLNWRDLLERVAARDDVEHIVLVVERKDGMSEVCYDRQTHANIVFASQVLNVHSDELVLAATVVDE